jgi:hypothetical protein
VPIYRSSDRVPTWILKNHLTGSIVLTRVKDFAFHADPTIMDLRGIVQRIIGLNPIPRWIQMWHDGKVLRLLPLVDSIAPEYADVKAAAGRAVPFVIIPFREICDEVARFVEKEAEK